MCSTNIECYVPGTNIKEISKIYSLSMRNLGYIKQISNYNLKGQLLK